MKRPYKYWTTKDHARFIELYPHENNKELAKVFGRTPGSLNIYARKHGVKKSDEFMQTKGGRFNSETAGWNRGKNFRPAGSEVTHFKKGQLPNNTRPLGAERTDKDGILWRKTAETRVKHKDWTPVKNLIYIENFGPIPNGRFVIHANRDKSDFTPSNLVAITQAENARRNVNRAQAIETLKKTLFRKKAPAFAKFINVALEFANNPLPPALNGDA